MKLSVVIVNYNVKYFLEQALLSAYKSIDVMNAEHPTYGAEIFVVDNNSADGSIEMVKSRFPEVKLIANTENTGFSFANNQAIRQSSGEYILLLNPDTVVEEDCFLKTIEYMDAHLQAGGLGVKMVDGKGKFLPESKRGLPSPAVAFYKISGLSALFPKSKIFGRYHLGFLSKDETHEVDVLAGAFMLLRKATLDKTGLLDEDFFMYGEDIDLSYRILKAGYRNIYFPHTSIIHYKGESTKKSSVNYVFVFYKAMIIFAQKHYSKKRAFVFSILLNIAIYMRAAFAVVVRFAKQLLLPLMDAGFLFLAMYGLKLYWETTIKFVTGGKYPPEFMQVFVPAYIILWMLGLFLSHAYQRPFRFGKIVRGVVSGTIMITVMYAFLSEEYRFSRALIILGAIIAILIFSINRLIVTLLKDKSLKFTLDEDKKLLIVGSITEAARVEKLLEKTKINFNLIGNVNPKENIRANEEYLGTINQLTEIAEIYKIDEVIFCAKDISSHDIIYWMSHINNKNVDFKIVPEESLFVIGSNSKNRPGDYYSYELELAIAKGENRLNKRLFDFISSLSLLLTLPVNIWFVKNKGSYFANLFSVLGGRKTWVSYAYTRNDFIKLPKLNIGVLTPGDELKNFSLDEITRKRLDYLYAKDYSVYKDLSIFVNGFSKLGNVKLVPVENN